ncbi:hypothetical protein [Microbacterium marinilacus]|uniref:DUF5134 domain-containing protein n=1 Tax=Microbacterium marinilacus TaxID=415209 RepID=A0ABP7BWR1_9MICO|nr:hypothetical protein [Microbacterium marinilacus]MBY0688215.1 hypothetical protein [Microbacterium marinilacus]
MPPLILSLAMIVPGAVCVVCAAAARPRASRTAVAGAAAMLAAMVAMSAGALAAPIAWTAALIALALAAAMARRVRRGRGAAGSHEAFDWHRPIGIVVTGALIAGMSAGTATTGHAHGPSASLIVVAAVVYLGALVTWMVRRRRELTPRHAAEGISMAIMTAAMLAMPSLA